MNPVIYSLNDILSDWKRQHDVFSNITSKFQVIHGYLSFDKYPLCKLEDDLLLSFAEIDNEGIRFFFNKERSIFIAISWPEDQPPVISSVSFVYHLSDVDNQEKTILSST